MLTIKEAYHILGLSPQSTPKEVKRQYRRLMQQVHPDVFANGKTGDILLAQKINLAYSLLKGQMGEVSSQPSRKKEKTWENSWDAPVNPQAYTEREILHYAEDQEGNILGSFSIPKGKYLWTMEEDFRLFHLSIYRCVREILEEIETAFLAEPEREKRQFVEGELAYLLAQQFIDGIGLLKTLAKEEAEEKGSKKETYRTFVLSAMAEMSEASLSPKPGQLLFPGGIRRHRLNLKDAEGRTIGYLSFPDDRLYYVIIPLFEQRRVQVKIMVTGNGIRKKYCSLKLWIRLPEKTSCRQPENLNQQIERLLKKYQFYGSTDQR